MPDGAASQRGEGSQDPGSGGEGRPRSLLRPRNPTTGRAADDRILSVREGESPAVPSWPSIVLYLGGLSFSSPSVLPTVAMHPQTPHQPPLQALLDLGSSSSEKTGNGMVHTQKLLPQVHELGGPDRLLLGLFQRGLWRRRRKTGTPTGSTQQADRSRPDRPLRQTPEAFWHLASFQTR